MADRAFPAVRGLTYDLARNQKPRMPFLKRLIDELAVLDYNMLVINLEYRFDFPSAPGVCPPGGLSSRAARELTDYGRSHGIEVVPEPNFTGHCEGMLALERYSALACDPYAQAPWGGYEQPNLDLPEARALVESMFADLCAAFPESRIHIGCDEIRRMEYLFPEDRKAQLEATERYLRFVLELGRRHNRELMMWGDMPLRHRELLEAIPREVLICDWHYGPQGSRETLERYRDAGYPVLSCPAVDTFSLFAVDTETSYQNIRAMLCDARDLGLEGFILTSWESGWGSGPDLAWPWIEMAMQLARDPSYPPGAGGRAAADAGATDAALLAAAFARRRYGVAEAAFGRLCRLLGRELQEAFSGATPPVSTGQIRRLLFRSSTTTLATPRLSRTAASGSQHLWEPSPFQVWLYLRAILTGERMEKLRGLAAEAEELAGVISREAKRHSPGYAQELTPLTGLARSLRALVDRLSLLGEAQAEYHRAALAQQSDARVFRACLAKAAAKLLALRPGMQVLRDAVSAIDRTSGLDPGELQWLVLQEQSLNEHIEALRQKEPAGDSLLEFGEFLRRPAQAWPRLTWR